MVCVFEGRGESAMQSCYKIKPGIFISTLRWNIIVTLFVFLFGTLQPIHANTEQAPSHQAKTSESHLFTKSSAEKKEHPSIEVLPEVNAALEVAGVSGSSYRARSSRELYFDAFRMRNVIFHFSLREKILFTSSPNQLDHEFTYAGLTYRATHGYISLFWDHTCHNPSRKLPETEKNGIHWNELGVAYETTGMKIGHKNDGVTFTPGSEQLNRINWSISLSKIWMRTENTYEWMGKFQVRYDVFRHERHIFFMQGSLDSIHDERGLTHTYSVEIGDRFCWYNNDCLIPFISYKKYHDWYGMGRGENFLLAGLRLEMNLGKDSYSSVGVEDVKWSWNPDIHVTGGYANTLGDSTFGHSSDFSLILDILQWSPHSKFSIYTFAGILTLPDDLNPYMVKYEIGPSIDIDFHNYSVTFFHSYACLYGVERSDVIKYFHLLGMAAENRKTFPWNWRVRLGGYPASKNFNYWGDGEGSLRYNFLVGRISPYIHFSGHLLAGDDSELGYTLESGVKIQGERGSFSIYLRRQDNNDIFRYGKGRQTLLGIRFEF